MRTDGRTDPIRGMKKFFPSAGPLTVGGGLLMDRCE